LSRAARPRPPVCRCAPRSAEAEMRKPEPRIRSEMRCKNIRHPDSRPASVVPRHGAEPEAVRAVRCDFCVRSRGEHANAEKATRRRRERIEDRMRRRSLYRSGMVISFYHDANIITMHTHPRDQGSSGGGPGAVERGRGRQGHCGALTHCAPTPATVATAPVLCGPIRCAIAVVFAAQRHEVALHAGCAGRSSTRPDGERPPIMHTAARCDALVYKSIEATSAAVCRALKSRAN
jgi:hypothetical protein